MFNIAITEDELSALQEAYSKMPEPSFKALRQVTEEREKELSRQISAINKEAKEATKHLQDQIDALVTERDHIMKPILERTVQLKKEKDSLWSGSHYRHNYPAVYDQRVLEWQKEVMVMLQAGLKLSDPQFKTLWEFAEVNADYDTDYDGDPVEGSEFSNAVDIIFQLLHTFKNMNVELPSYTPNE